MSSSSKRPLLTARQIEVLSLVGQGHSNREVSKLLDISVQGVKQHLANINKRLTVNNRGQAARAARRLGLISDD